MPRLIPSVEAVVLTALVVRAPDKIRLLGLQVLPH